MAMACWAIFLEIDDGPSAERLPEYEHANKRRTVRDLP